LTELIIMKSSVNPRYATKPDPIHLMFGSSQHRSTGNVLTHEDADIVVVSLSDRIVIPRVCTRLGAL
jgi:hypothetical protein